MPADLGPNGHSPPDPFLFRRTGSQACWSDTGGVRLADTGPARLMSASTDDPVLRNPDREAADNKARQLVGDLLGPVFAVHPIPR
jgi:hypothetical protein